MDCEGRWHLIIRETKRLLNLRMAVVFSGDHSVSCTVCGRMGTRVPYMVQTIVQYTSCSAFALAWLSI